MAAADLLYELTPPVVWRWLRDRPHAEDSKDIPSASGVRYIFVHIHKCAGTSLRKTLSREPGFLCCATRPGRFEDRLSRSYIEDSVWRESFKFTFVRNPFARVVSAFKMFHRSPRWREVFPDFTCFVDFLRWSDVSAHCVDAEIPMGRFVRSLDNVLHHCSAYHNPKYMIDQMDYIGRVETMQQDLGAISAKADVTFPQIPHLNATRRDEYQRYYDRHTERIITEKYQHDLDRFEYTF